MWQRKLQVWPRRCKQTKGLLEIKSSAATSSTNPRPHFRDGEGHGIKADNFAMVTLWSWRDKVAGAGLIHKIAFGNQRWRVLSSWRRWRRNPTKHGKLVGVQRQLMTTGRWSSVQLWELQRQKHEWWKWGHAARRSGKLGRGKWHFTHIEYSWDGKCWPQLRIQLEEILQWLQDRLCITGVTVTEAQRWDSPQVSQCSGCCGVVLSNTEWTSGTVPLV